MDPAVVAAATPVITPLYAVILGVVEGLTEFLPVSSTGHLILAAHGMGLNLDDPGVQAFQIVIQAGALLAVIGIYMKSIRAMVAGAFGRDRDGLRLAVQLIVAFLPAAVIGLLAGDFIHAHLFGARPVVAALAAGGVAMLLIERWRVRRLHGHEGRALTEMTWKLALIVGCAQCVAMWPGTSRSMMTIVAALLLGFSPRAAAEFSFLLALPTLGAATAYDMLSKGGAVLHASGVVGLALGLIVSCIVAWLAVKGLLAYLTKHGLAVFGWYRLALAAVVLLLLG
jgi:undecaprenyl-diphosphatase